MLFWQDTKISEEQAMPDRIIGIDVLRGMAVLMVVLNHIPHYAKGGFRENPFFFPALLMDYGYLGVSLFVIISGFCIHRRAAMNQSLGKPRVDWVAFWKRRFWRLYPPYLAAIFLSVLIVFVLKGSFAQDIQSLSIAVLCHLLMVHNVTTFSSAPIGNPAFWSLGMEEQLYLLYIPLALMLSRFSWPRVLILVAGYTLLWRWTCFVPFLISADTDIGLGNWGLWPFSFWLYWTLGAYSVDAHFKNVNLPKALSNIYLACAFIGVGLIQNVLFFRFLSSTRLSSFVPFEWNSQTAWMISSFGELAISFGFFITLNWMLLPQNAKYFHNYAAIGLAYLGKISYSIYLTHFPIITLLIAYLPFEHSLSDWVLRLLIYLTICTAFGSLFYLAVERWFLHLPKPKSTSPTTAPSLSR